MNTMQLLEKALKQQPAPYWTVAANAPAFGKNAQDKGHFSMKGF